MGFKKFGTGEILPEQVTQAEAEARLGQWSTEDEHLLDEENED